MAPLVLWRARLAPEIDPVRVSDAQLIARIEGHLRAVRAVSNELVDLAHDVNDGIAISPERINRLALRLHAGLGDLPEPGPPPTPL